MPPSEVARLAGVSPQKIGSWARYGIVLAERDEGRVLLRKEFGLTDEEIDEAVSYEEDVEKAVSEFR